MTTLQFGVSSVVLHYEVVAYVCVWPVTILTLHLAERYPL